MDAAARSFGARIRLLRRSSNLTQAALSEHIGVTEEWVRRLERGAAKPSFDTIMSLANALNVPPAALFDGDHAAASDHVSQLLVQLSQLRGEELAWLSKLVSDLLARPSRT